MHKYRFDCQLKNGHNHRLLGYASNMLGLGTFHIHFYYGVSSYQNHTHHFYGITGRPIKTENGHVHKMEGVLECSSLHEHDFKGFTFEDTTTFSSMQAVSYVR